MKDTFTPKPGEWFYCWIPSARKDVMQVAKMEIGSQEMLNHWLKFYKVYPTEEEALIDNPNK